MNPIFEYLPHPVLDVNLSDYLPYAASLAAYVGIKVVAKGCRWISGRRKLSNEAQWLLDLVSDPSRWEWSSFKIMVTKVGASDWAYRFAHSGHNVTQDEGVGPLLLGSSYPLKVDSLLALSKRERRIVQRAAARTFEEIKRRDNAALAERRRQCAVDAILDGMTEPETY